MIPKIDYQKHDVLTRVFLPPFKKKSDFDNQSKEFVKKFRKIEKDVLVLIEKFSGFKWSKKKIPVYLVPNGHLYSVARGDLERGLPGVVQKVFETNERSTPILIHELTHVNQFQSDFNSKKNKFIFNKKNKRDNLKVEVCTDVVCINVIRELFGEKSKYEKDYWEFLNKLMISTPGKEKQIPIFLKKWDLNKKTLREYIFK